MIDNLNNITMGFIYFYITSIFLGISYLCYLLLCACDKKRAWSFFIKFEVYMLVFGILCWGFIHYIN